MIVRCWGARGSVPVSGKDYLKYGGDTTCIEIRTNEKEVIIIDAGTGIRRLGNRLVQKNISDLHILFTHAHWDHLIGFPFFRPIYKETTTAIIYGCPFAQSSIRQFVSKTMAPPNFPVNYDSLRSRLSFETSCSAVFSIGAVSIVPIMLSHPNRGIGYKFIEGDKSFVFLTDNELSYKHPGGMDYTDYRDFAVGADLLVHDAEFTPKEYGPRKSWGHSPYTDALNLAMDSGARRFGLFHHNQDHTDDDVDTMVKKCNAIAHRNNSSLECFALFQDMEIIL